MALAFFIMHIHYIHGVHMPGVFYIAWTEVEEEDARRLQMISNIRLEPVEFNFDLRIITFDVQ